jgi:cytochrome P450
MRRCITAPIANTIYVGQFLATNREGGVFASTDQLDIERENARRHLSFSYGVLRCLGARLTTLQVRLLMEEMAARRMRFEVLEEPVHFAHSFVNGYEAMTAWASHY